MWIIGTFGMIRKVTLFFWDVSVVKRLGKETACRFMTSNGMIMQNCMFLELKLEIKIGLSFYFDRNIIF